MDSIWTILRIPDAFAYTRVCVFMCMYVYLYIYKDIHMPCAHACMYVCMHACMHACTHTPVELIHVSLWLSKLLGFKEL